MSKSAAAKNIPRIYAIVDVIPYLLDWSVDCHRVVKLHEHSFVVKSSSKLAHRANTHAAHDNTMPKVSAMTPDLTVSRDIAASPEAVFAAIADVTRMGEWSPECVRAEWSDGFSKPEVGAMFMGHNVNGDKEWSVESKIVELVDNERFFFDCISSVTPGFVFASWGYSIEPTASGCTVTEYWQDHRPESMLERSAIASGVGDRVTHNRAGMEATLERVAAAVE